MQNNENSQKAEKVGSEKQDQRSKQKQQTSQAEQTERTNTEQTEQKEKQEKQEKQQQEKQQQEKQQKQQAESKKGEAQELKQTSTVWHQPLLQPVEFDTPSRFQVQQSLIKTTQTIATEKQKLEEKMSDVVGLENEEKKQEKEIKYKPTLMYETEQFYKARQKFYAEAEPTEQISPFKIEDLADLSDIERRVIKIGNQQPFAPERNIQQSTQDEQIRKSQAQQFEPVKFDILMSKEYAKEYVGQASIKKKAIKLYE